MKAAKITSQALRSMSRNRIRAALMMLGIVVGLSLIHI